MEPPSDAPGHDVEEVTPGALCRLTMHDDPFAVARAMAAWFDDPDAVSSALTWLTELTDALDEYARRWAR
jgi:hypothetical protein